MNFINEPEFEGRLGGEIRYVATNASYSDEEGNLIAFSNGIQVLNNDGIVIPGAENLQPDGNYPAGYTTLQGMLFLPSPGQEDAFYSFSGDRFIFQDSNDDYQGGFDSLTYCKFRNTGTVELEEYRELILYDTLYPQKIIATKHANGRDWWLLFNVYDTNKFYKILLDPDGFSIPDFQNIGEVPFSGGLDQAHYSPDGAHYAFYSYSGNTGTVTRSSVDLFSFDRCSGQLSNPQRHIFPSPNGGPGGIAFSPNSQYMYVSLWDSIVQYDLYSPDIFESEVTVAKYDGFISPGPDSVQNYPTRFFQMQLAPNDKIYVNIPNVVSRFLHVIDQPNEKGIACNVLQHEIQLPYFNWVKMPNFPNYRLGALENSGCDTLGPVCQFTYDVSAWDYAFTDMSTNDPTFWHWDFGDGNIASEQDPSHTFAASGMYEVCLTASNDYGEDIYCESITVIDTDIKETDLSSEIAVLPNPAVSEVHFVFPETFVLEHLGIYDSSGRLLRRYEGNHSSIDLGIFHSGVYLFEFVDKKGRKVMKRVVLL